MLCGKFMKQRESDRMVFVGILGMLKLLKVLLMERWPALDTLSQGRDTHKLIVNFLFDVPIEYELLIDFDLLRGLPPHVSICTTRLRKKFGNDPRLIGIKPHLWFFEIIPINKIWIELMKAVIWSFQFSFFLMNYMNCHDFPLWLSINKSNQFNSIE